VLVYSFFSLSITLLLAVETPDSPDVHWMPRLWRGRYWTFFYSSCRVVIMRENHMEGRDMAGKWTTSFAVQ